MIMEQERQITRYRNTKNPRNKTRVKRRKIKRQKKNPKQFFKENQIDKIHIILLWKAWTCFDQLY